MQQQTFCTSFTFKPGAVSSPGVPQGEASQAGAVAQSRPNTEASAEVAKLNLSPAMKAAYKKKFDAFDLNKDGIITRREFLAVSKVFGYSLTSEEIMVSAFCSPSSISLIPLSVVVLVEGNLWKDRH